MSSRAQRAAVVASAVLAASVCGAAPHAAPAGGPIPEPIGGLVGPSTPADRDGDRVFDALERRLAGSDDRPLAVLVALDRPATPALVDEVAASTGISVRHVFQLVNGFAATATVVQVRALARDPRVVHVEAGSAASTLDVSAEASFGVTRARARVPGLDGDRDGDPAAYSPADLVAAVVDTGLDADHGDLDGGKVLAFADCRDLVAGCHDAAPGDDVLFGHGTHVAATLAGDHGVAPGAALVGVRVLDPRSPAADDKARMLAGVEWVVAHRAQLGIEALNLSIGIPVDGPQGEGCSSGLDLLSQAVEAATAAGLVVVTAAGNSGPGRCTIGSPAAAPSAITVGNIADVSAAGETEGRPVLGFKLHVSSGRGPTADGRTKPDLVGPGVEITSAAAGTQAGTWDGTGTSAAAPFVTGTALLVLDAAPGLTPAQVKGLLTSTAVDWGPPGPDVDYGAGRLDAFASLRAAGADVGPAPASPLHETFAGALDAGETHDYSLDVSDLGYPLAATLLVPDATTDPSRNLDLELRGPGGAVVAVSDRVPGTSPMPNWPAWPGRQEELGIMPAATGTYVLRVRSAAGAAAYVLDVSRGPAAPANQTRPAVAGSPLEGTELTASPGTWEGSPAALSYRWVRCPPCAAISGADGPAYTAVRDDIGSRLVVRVTATNGGAAVDADSDPTADVRGRLPENLGPPGIVGTATVGETLTADAGTWTGTAPIGTQARWLRCGADGTGCAAAGAEGTQRQLGAADVDARIRVTVIGTNACALGCGSSHATSPASEIVAGSAPLAGTLSVQGPALVGASLQASVTGFSPGIPAGTMTVTWLRCPAESPCLAVGQGAAYTVAAADLGTRLQAEATVENSCLRGCGSAHALSSPTAPVEAAPPAADVPPAVWGPAEDGQTLTATDGLWSGVAPIAVARRWLRCDPVGAACAELAGATGSTLLLGVADIGSTVRVRVTATNPGGPTTVDSEPSAVVAPAPPRSTAPPAVLGTPRRDAVLVAGTGTWAGTRPLSLGIAWLRCRKRCTSLRKHGVRYVPTPADVGARLRIRVTAANAAGGASTDSPSTAPVAPALPRIGTAAADALAGTPWDDVIRGRGGNDRILGLGGGDDLAGGAGADRVEGGSGPDRLTGGPGADRLVGGSGADRIEARDGVRDAVSCGPGRDVARVDRGDRTTGCERVVRPRLGRRPLL